MIIDKANSKKAILKDGPKTCRYNLHGEISPTSFLLASKFRYIHFPKYHCTL